MDDLPDYMQIFYGALLNVVSEIEEEMAKEGRSYRVYYVKESVRITYIHKEMILTIYMIIIMHDHYFHVCTIFFSSICLIY